MVEVMETSFKRTYVSKLWLPGQLYSVPLTPCQATVDPHLCQRLLDTHRQVWVTLLCGHCSFLLGPGVHKVLFVPPKSLFPLSCARIPLVSKVKFPGGSQSFCLISRLGNLLWVLELFLTM